MCWRRSPQQRRGGDPRRRLLVEHRVPRRRPPRPDVVDGDDGDVRGGRLPGVTATSITIGAISSRSGMLAGYFGQFAPGMTAYFDSLNAKGGSTGGSSNLAYNLDDGGSPSQFTQLTHTLIDQDHVFAVGAASPFFSPATSPSRAPRPTGTT